MQPEAALYKSAASAKGEVEYEPRGDSDLKDAIYGVLEERFIDRRRRPFNATRMIRQIDDDQLIPVAEAPSSVFGCYL